MNHSSLFSFEESSVWDPKVMREYMIVTQDQLTKLNSIPGWTKVQDDYNNTLRLGKDLSIESSQSESSVNVIQNSQKIEKNTELFERQIEKHKNILKTYQVYEEKLPRSLSLLSINKTSENLLSNKTLKRSWSLQNLCQSSDIGDVTNHFRELSNQCQISLSGSRKGEFHITKEINFITMERVSQLPVTVPTPVGIVNSDFETVKESNGVSPTENSAVESSKVSDQLIKPVIQSVNVDKVDLLSEIAKESNGVLPANNIAVESSNMSNQLMKHVVTQSVNADNVDFISQAIKESNFVTPAVKIASLVNYIVTDQPMINGVTQAANTSDVEATKENNGVLLAENVATCPNNVSNEPSKTVVNESVNVSNSIASSLKKIPESHVPVAKDNLVTNGVNEVPANVISVGEIDRSSDLKLQKLCPSKSTALDIPTNELSTVSGTVHLFKSSASDTKGDLKECDDGKCDPAKGESSSSKKRKLESRNKRSKRLRSEEKQGNIKIRSIKKVGEICYSVDEVKTMLDIIKHFS